jgi:hypothetical protein
MKKFMSLALGLSLLTGAASLFAQDTGKDDGQKATKIKKDAPAPKPAPKDKNKKGGSTTPPPK